jgi:hypothetical protein
MLPLSTHLFSHWSIPLKAKKDTTLLSNYHRVLYIVRHFISEYSFSEKTRNSDMAPKLADFKDPRIVLMVVIEDKVLSEFFI